MGNLHAPAVDGQEEGVHVRVGVLFVATRRDQAAAQYNFLLKQDPLEYFQILPASGKHRIPQLDDEHTLIQDDSLFAPRSFADSHARRELSTHRVLRSYVLMPDSATLDYLNVLLCAKQLNAPVHLLKMVDVHLILTRRMMLSLRTAQGASACVNWAFEFLVRVFRRF